MVSKGKATHRTPDGRRSHLLNCNVSRYAEQWPSGEAGSNQPQAGATAIGILGYSNSFKDSVYQLSFEFPHTGSTLTLEFGSSLFEGKGTADESWACSYRRWRLNHATIRASRSARLFSAS